VEKDEDFIPLSSLTFPIGNGAMPDLDQNNAISVHYDHPVSSNIHKSMLLRGVKMPDAVLNQGDIEAVKSRANRSGGSYGGAPFERNGHRGNGRGGRGGGYNHNSNSDRPNPFAAHLPPGMVAPNGMPPSPFPGWMPPPPNAAGYGSYGQGQPPPPMPFPPPPFNNQYQGQQRPPPPQNNPYGNGAYGGYGGYQGINGYGQNYGR
jgi:5'-3' exoribonuclease 2